MLALSVARKLLLCLSVLSRIGGERIFTKSIATYQVTGDGLVGPDKRKKICSSRCS